MDYQTQIDRAVLGVQAKLGEFLATGNTLYGYKDRIAPYKSASVKAVYDVANALNYKADGLLSNFKTIQAEAMDTIAKANALKVQMERDPSFKPVGGVAPDMSQLGTWAKSFLNSGIIMKATSTVSSLGSITLKIVKHNRGVSDLGAAINDLDNLAAGKNVSAKLGQVLASTTQNVVYILAGGLAIYLFGPGLIRKVFKK